jgi:hypothetical protein
MILNAVDRIQNGTGGLEASINKRELKQIFKLYLEIYIRVWDDNLKWILKTLVLFSDSFLHHNAG